MTLAKEDLAKKRLNTADMILEKLIADTPTAVEGEVPAGARRA